MALSEAYKARGLSSPNPAVGCVILDKNRHFLCAGHTQRPGHAHAEVDALNKVKDQELLKGAHVFSTLEPCSKQGRTPACAKTLSLLPIASVTYGLADPHPTMKDGASILREAGKDVALFEDLKEELHESCEIFFHNLKTKMPFVALKVATSADGKFAPDGDQSEWITGQESREHVHELRGQYDAILIGRKTFETDNPFLNIRFGPRKGKDLKVFVLDPTGASINQLENSNLLKNHSSENIFWVTKQSLALTSPRLPTSNILQVPLEKNNLDLSTFLEQIYQKGICSVFVEGGAKTYGSFVNQKLANRLYHFKSASLWGSRGRTWDAYFKADLKLTQTRSHKLGADTFISGLIL